MRRILFILLALIIPLSLYSRGDGRRIYMDASRTCSISVSGDTLTVCPTAMDSGREIPSSVCSLRKVSGNVYEATIISRPFPNLIEQYDLSYKTSGEQLAAPPAVEDSIRIVLHLPYDYPLVIEVSSLPDDPGVRSIYDRHNNSILFPKKRYGGGFHFSFSPQDIQPQDIAGSYFGIVKAYLDCVINATPAEVHISVPELDAAFFERYQIHNELVIIKKDYIYWRGTTFFRLP